MKLLVSDYDNTFHIKDVDMEENVRKANEFRKDNLFVIATGRSYDSYKQAQEQFNIKSDYLVVNHGGTILKDNEVIYNYCIDNLIKDEIVNLLKFDHIKNILCYSGIEEVDIKNETITKVMIEYDDEKFVPELKQIIEEKFSDKIKTYIFSNFKSLEIIPKEVDKSTAVDYISKLENIDDIYVIGDNHNDYLMIKNYGGSCTHVAVEEVKKIAKKEYQNVSDFINEIME